ncbi:MAG TPA: DUF6504 family protein [Candidatus Cybelea sp.]|jgi:hypothetical protein|nr:DUF6504 family protein [Candidatus Cybelea sp.]
MTQFVSRPIVPASEEFVTPASGAEPPLPRAFSWDGRTLAIREVIRSWRTTKDDRGDTYLKRHWFELRTADDLTIVVYYDRAARRGAPPWWLYTVG